MERGVGPCSCWDHSGCRRDGGGSCRARNPEEKEKALPRETFAPRDASEDQAGASARRGTQADVRTDVIGSVAGKLATSLFLRDPDWQVASGPELSMV